MAQAAVARIFDTEQNLAETTDNAQRFLQTLKSSIGFTITEEEGEGQKHHTLHEACPLSHCALKGNCNHWIVNIKSPVSTSAWYLWAASLLEVG